jgi:ADP-heptose:LPS heptosyltransferase
MWPIKRDCRSYRASMPCAPHKHDGRTCGECTDYDPIRTRLLIVKLGAIGDVLRTTCLLPALRSRWQAAHITWITEPAAAPVLAGHPLIDRILSPAAAVPVLLVERFDAVYGLEADPPSAALAALARADTRAGFSCDDRGRVAPVNESAVAWWLMGLDDRRKRENRRTYQDLMLELCGVDGPAAPPSFSVPPVSRARAEAFRRERGLDLFRAVLGLNTGAGSRWAQKKWTPQAYARFMDRCRARHPDVAVVLLGGPDEVELNARLMAGAADGVFDGGCDNSFADFAALVQQLSLLVTPDSLGLHTAQAVGTPAVVFVGPTSPWELEMYGRGAVVHAAGVECLGCYLPVCDKPATCMERLEPEPVLAAAEPWLAASPASCRAPDIRAGLSV